MSYDGNSGAARLRAIISAYQAPILSRGLAQLATTFIPFFGVVAAMYALSTVSCWLSLALAIPAAGLIVRIFIIQHDCGHGAFFRSRMANRWLGRFCSLITMTPYAEWQKDHARHHAVWNNLDERHGAADIYSTCLTVREYCAHSRLGRWWRRAVRHPLVSHLLLPPLVFIFVYRNPLSGWWSWRPQWRSILLTDLGLAILATVLVLCLGWEPTALVQLPAMAIAAIIGIWIFSVQHRFEDAVWLRQNNWSAADAALFGTSFLKLPRVLQWFSGNIGFHHIHHLQPRVPNYRLEECHRACAAILPAAKPLTLMRALRAPAYALWDEENAQMIRFSDLAPASLGTSIASRRRGVMTKRGDYGNRRLHPDRQ